jgi:hypothetical protein
MPDVPATASYAYTAYVIAALILVSYAVILWRRGRKG